MGVVHGQEGDGEQRGGDEADAAVEQPRPRPHQEADGRRAEHGRQRAGDGEDVAPGSFANASDTPSRPPKPSANAPCRRYV